MVAEMDGAARLKIAVQKSGRLTENSLDLLVRCGLKYSRGKDQLMCYGENMPLDVLFVRDDDIPDLVHLHSVTRFACEDEDLTGNVSSRKVEPRIGFPVHVLLRRMYHEGRPMETRND